MGRTVLSRGVSQTTRRLSKIRENEEEDRKHGVSHTLPKVAFGKFLRVNKILPGSMKSNDNRSDRDSQLQSVGSIDQSITPRYQERAKSVVKTR